MARPLGIALLVGTALAVIGWSSTQLPEPVVALAYAAGDGGDGTGVDGGPQGPTPAAPLEVLADAGFDTKAEALAPVGPGHLPGVYRVADAPAPAPAPTTGKDRKRNSRNRHRVVQDRDVTPRVSPYDDDELFVEGNIAPVTPAVPRGELKPGLYATSFDTEGCSYELTRVMKDREVSVIGEDYLGAGRMLVHLNEIEPDWFVSNPRCGAWYAWSPLPVALTEAGNGDYWVGDLARGVWDVPAGCRWEKVVSFRGAGLDDVQAYGAGPGTVEVDYETYGVRVRNCTSPLGLDVKATEAWSEDITPSRS